MYSDELNMLVLRTEGYSSLHGVHQSQFGVHEFVLNLTLSLKEEQKNAVLSLRKTFFSAYCVQITITLKTTE